MGTQGVSTHAVPGYAHLIDPNKKWYNNRRLVLLHAWIVLFLITSSTNGFDSSLLNAFQTLGTWRDYFHNPVGGKLGILNAIQHIGSLAAYPIAPYLSDGIGRRRTIFIGATIMLAAVVVQSAAQNIGMFIGARFLIGLGYTFAGNAAPMLVTEISYPSYRAPLTSLFNSLYTSGSLIASWTTFGTQHITTNWSWRIPSIMQGLPSVLQFFLVLLAPESPRWLLSKGKDAEALRTLAYYHGDGDEHDPLVQYEFHEIKAALDFDRIHARSIGWKSLIATPGNRKRVILIVAISFFSQWSGNGLVSYYLNKVFDSIGITNTTIQLLINGILSIWNLIIAVGASFLVDKVGRRPLFLISTGGMIVFFTLQTVCSAQFALHGNDAAAHAVIAFVFLFFAFYELAYAPLIVSYTVEILPYSIRAKGLTVFSFTNGVALIFNQYINPIALEHIAWRYYIVYCCWLGVEFVFLYFMLIETKNRSLEETAVLFDSEDAVKQLFGRAAQEVQRDNFEEKDSEYVTEVALET